ncbi:MAG: hypothetical protein KIT15_08275 [Xanthobacteraceae bacterium]|nr:hypothetical protein [Xanthobacteraceae bacterium]MCW5674563.1 hypothetical protein [Xanthobacteraceae bacterium]
MTIAIRGLLGRIGRIFMASELHALDAAQVEELARDIGVTAGDLYRLEQAGSEPVAMPRRLALEGVNPAVVEAKWPSVWKDMQRVCSLCDNREICRDNLASARGACDLPRYCPNTGSIEAFTHNL